MTTYNLRYVARHLRYLPLPDLVGETVVLCSLRTTFDDAIQHVRTKFVDLQFTQRYDERQIEVCLAKYSFWDATWRVDGNVEWTGERRRLDLLSDLAYFSTGAEAKQVNEWLDGIDVHEVLREDIEAGQVYLRLFLQTNSEPVGMYSRRWPSWLDPVESGLLRLGRRLPWWLRWSKPPYSLPRWFFPHQCVIVDAALTNLQGCWMARYPYI